MTIRLTSHQDAAIRARTKRRELRSNSDALRELLDLGLILDRGEAHGVVVTDAARDFIRGAGPALVQFAVYGDDEVVGEHDRQVLGIGDESADALAHGGALLICTPEQLRELE